MSHSSANTENSAFSYHFRNDFSRFNTEQEQTTKNIFNYLGRTLSHRRKVADFAETRKSDVLVGSKVLQ